MISRPSPRPCYVFCKLRWLSAVTLIVLSGCKFITRDAGADQAARSLFEEVSQHQTEAFTNRLDPALRNTEAQSQIAAIETLIPACARCR